MGCSVRLAGSNSWVQHENNDVSSLTSTTSRITLQLQAGRTKKRNLDETLVLNRISTSRHLARAHVHCTYVMGVYQASNVTDNRPLLRESPKTVISLLLCTSYNM